MLGVKKSITAIFIFAFSAIGFAAEDSAWVQIFNGKDLTDWTPKFENATLGVNVDTTFLVQNGLLTANEHTPLSHVGFGHLFYTKHKFSYYIVRAEYKFQTDVSAPGFPSWTTQNNGLMIHSQDPATIPLSGSYPTSLEVQLLGPKSTAIVQPSNDWPVGFTGNLCFVGTNVTWQGKVRDPNSEHCIAAQYPDAWKGTRIPWDQEFSDIQVRVLSDSLITTTIRGKVVFEYSKPIIVSGSVPLKDGFITVQAEGSSTQFRKIEVLDLVGCMDKSKPGYRTYFVKNDNTLCNVTTATSKINSPIQNATVVRTEKNLLVSGHQISHVELLDMSGKVIEARSAASGANFSFSIPKPALYILRIATKSGTQQIKVPFY